MAPLADPQLLGCFMAILADWYVTDAVTIKKVAEDWGGKNLPNFTLKGLAKLMNDHVLAGGEIDQVRETRPEWNDRNYHYDFQLPWAGRPFYIKTVLVDDDPKNPYIPIVSLHDA